MAKVKVIEVHGGYCYDCGSIIRDYISATDWHEVDGEDLEVLRWWAKEYSRSNSENQLLLIEEKTKDEVTKAIKDYTEAARKQKKAYAEREKKKAETEKKRQQDLQRRREEREKKLRKKYEEEGYKG